MIGASDWLVEYVANVEFGVGNVEGYVVMASGLRLNGSTYVEYVEGGGYRIRSVDPIFRMIFTSGRWFEEYLPL